MDYSLAAKLFTVLLFVLFVLKQSEICACNFDEIAFTTVVVFFVSLLYFSF